MYVEDPENDKQPKRMNSSQISIQALALVKITGM
jgi:hypothetical protein